MYGLFQKSTATTLLLSALLQSCSSNTSFKVKSDKPEKKRVEQSPARNKQVYREPFLGDHKEKGHSPTPSLSLLASAPRVPSISLTPSTVPSSLTLCPNISGNSPKTDPSTTFKQQPTPSTLKLYKAPVKQAKQIPEQRASLDGDTQEISRITAQSFTALGGQQVQFIRTGNQWKAIVTEPDGKTQVLPVVCQEGYSLERLSVCKEPWQSRHIHLYTSTKGKSVVYVGVPGLRGGMKSAEEEEQKGDEQQAAPELAEEVAHLLTALSNGTWAASKTLIRLVKLSPAYASQIFPLLREIALGDEDREIRMDIFSDLIDLTEVAPELAPEVFTVFQRVAERNEDKNVRMAISWNLGKLVKVAPGLAPEIFQLLKRATSDGSLYVRSSTIGALGELIKISPTHASQVFPLLQRTLEDTREYEEVCNDALGVLRNLVGVAPEHTEQVCLLLQGAMRNRHEGVRRVASQVLEEVELLERRSRVKSAAKILPK